MANFGWFGDSEHRVFDYKPIYYNKEKDELKQKFGKVDGSMEKENGEYVPGTYLRGSFRDGPKKRSSNKAQKIITLIGLLLFAIVMIYITKFYSLL
ncbi:unknown [Bacteroides sp. CAG:545]|jgi:hypothetical protein|nr:hypothetical protein [Bacteroidales bacterium]MEE0315979.1 hypothetical protein [Bacteroidales bacterium]CCZ43500.1 unknown [Bacteroides sp. CAG:545]